METLSQAYIELGSATLPLPGQEESGDRYAAKAFPNGFLAAVVDGLGHGDEAALASEMAVRTLERYAHESVISLLNRCHEALRTTRGVVLSVASFNAQDGTMTWLGVGNVEGVLLRADPAASPAYESLLLRRGVVGGKLERPYASLTTVMPGDTLILATDGIRSGFTLSLSLNDSPQQVADRILNRHAKKTDDALVLVARYKGCGP